MESDEKKSVIKNWSSDDVIQFMETNGISDLSPIGDRPNGRDVLNFYGAQQNMRSVSENSGGSNGIAINRVIENYQPCDPKRCVVEGLMDTLTLDQATYFKIITKDAKGAIRSICGQKVEVFVNEGEFHLAEMFNCRNGVIEVTMVPLKVGPWKIDVELGNIPIAKSPFLVVVGPTPPPVNSIKKTQLEGWVEKAKGNFGKVYKGRCNNMDVAIKEMTGTNNKNLEQKMGEFLGEVNILQRLTHPNIISFLGVCLESDMVNEWYIVLEWADKASLQTVLQHEKNLSLELKFQFCINIAMGMAWLHHRIPPIVHFDLKPANILVFDGYVCKIADFGLSYISEFKESTATRGTMLYMPPETLLRKWYIKSGRNQRDISNLPTVPPDQITKIDVYAFGLIMWEICTGEEVFMEYNDIDVFCGGVCNKDVRPSTTDPKYKIPRSLSILMQHCWTKNPATRPSFRELITQFESARARTILEYPSEVSFWLSYWPTKFKVPFSHFVETLLGDIVLNKENLESLAFMLQTSVDEDVSMYGYKMLLDWFGPLHENDNLKKMELIMEAKWFFVRLMTSDEAAGILGRSKKSGTFLVRLNIGKTSPITPSPFTLSFLVGEKPNHLRINHTYPKSKPEGCFELLFTVEGKHQEFQDETLPGLIDQLTEKLPNYFSSPPQTLPVLY